MDVIKSAPTKCWEDSVHIAWFISDVGKNKQKPLRVGGVMSTPAWWCSWPWRRPWLKSDDEETRDGIVRSCFYHLQQLRSVRRSLTFDAANVLVHAFIHSRVDYCNAIYPLGGQRWGYQKVAISTACCCPSVDWCLSERAHHADPSWCAPLATSQMADHIQDCNECFQLCLWYVPGVFLCRLYASSDVAGRAKLRSARHGHLIVPATKTKTFVCRSFRSAAPTVWNCLPANLLDINISRRHFASIDSRPTRRRRYWEYYCSGALQMYWLIDWLKRAATKHSRQTTQCIVKIPRLPDSCRRF